MMVALFCASLVCALCGKYPQTKSLSEELVAVAEQQGALFWKAFGTSIQGWILGLAGQPQDAIRMLISGITLYTLLGHGQRCQSLWRDWRRPMPKLLSSIMLAVALAKRRQRFKRLGAWWEAEISRVAGEIALMPPNPEGVKAETFFERALAVARAQQAKSWELRAAMSLARLWRDQGRCGKRANCLLRFTAGSRKASTRLI